MHEVTYFHDAGDPYAHLMVQVLPELVRRYGVRLDAHLAGPPPDWAAPERARLEAYARKDAGQLAQRAGLDFTDPGRQPSSAALAAADAAFAAALAADDFMGRAGAISAALWSGAPVAAPSGPEADAARTALAAGAHRREALGHYLGATLHYGGEWYWGLDRLHYLEARLGELGLGAAGPPVFAPPTVPASRARQAPVPGPELHFFLSFRSPYTYIAAGRVRALAEAYGAVVRLRFVLPMVMRGLPVPRMKGRYIVQDVAREARRLGLAFGKIADPVGLPVERGYSLLPWAQAQGRGLEYCECFLAAVWSQGVDAGSDDGLRRIVEAAGLDWAVAGPLVGNDAWRAEAEANRSEMLALGLWGVPSFRVGDTAVWGQDRLWVIEDALRAATDA